MFAMPFPNDFIDGFLKCRNQLARHLLGIALLVAAFAVPNLAWAKDLTADERAALEARATKGDGAAMIELGNALVSKDERSALEWWKKGWKAGAKPEFGLAFIVFEAGNDDSRPFSEEDYRFFKAIYEQSDIPEKTAWFYKYGLGTPRDIPKAIALYTKQASKIGDDGKPSNGEAMWELGDIYENGYGVPIDFDRAAYWYRMALKTSADEFGWAGLKDLNNSHDYKVDEFTSKDAAVKVWEEHNVSIGLSVRADSFHSDRAMVLLGSHLASGKTALKYMERAAKRGYPPALNLMGVIYNNGLKGLAQNTKLACEYYLQAAELNNLEAMRNLAVSEYNGDCGPSNPEIAMKWLIAAVNQKHAKSYRQLGIILSNQGKHEASLLNLYKARFANAKHDKLEQEIAEKEKALPASKAREILATARREVLGDGGKQGGAPISPTPAPQTIPPAAKNNAPKSDSRSGDTDAPANQPPSQSANFCAGLSNGSAVRVSVPGYPQRFSAMVLGTSAGKATVRVMQPTAPQGVSGRSLTVSCQSLLRAQ